MQEWADYLDKLNAGASDPTPVTRLTEQGLLKHFYLSRLLISTFNHLRHIYPAQG